MVEIEPSLYLPNVIKFQQLRVAERRQAQIDVASATPTPPVSHVK